MKNKKILHQFRLQLLRSVNRDPNPQKNWNIPRLNMPKVGLEGKGFAAKVTQRNFGRVENRSDGRSERRFSDDPTIFGAQTADQGRLRDGDLTYARPRAKNRPSSFRHSTSWYIVVFRRTSRDLTWKKRRENRGTSFTAILLVSSQSRVLEEPRGLPGEPFAWSGPRRKHVTGFGNSNATENDFYCGPSS